MSKWCYHEWVDIPDPAGYVGEECKHCGINRHNVKPRAHPDTMIGRK